MKQEGNILHFDSDEEFYDWSVIPELVAKEADDGSYITDFDMTPAYNDAIQKKLNFMIHDEDSVICKRGCVTCHTISKPIIGLVEWFKPMKKKNK